jgi:cell division protein FtsB
MRVITATLLLLLAVLQHKVWFSDVGYVAADALREELDIQLERSGALEARNRLLTAEVLALKEGPAAAVESRARSELGMIRDGETFYLVPDNE